MKKHLKDIIFILFISLIGCGGGSVGTGTRVIEGSITDSFQNPVPLALVTLDQTGESSQTDENGQFAIDTSSKSENITLTVNSSNFEASVSLNKAQGERVGVDVTVDKNSGTAKVRNLSVTAKIVGKCDIAFENNAVIRQGNKLENGTECTLKVTISGNGVPVNDANFVLQHRECDETRPWRVSVEGKTSSLTPGIGQVNFIFKDDKAHCDYRIIAPYNYPGLKNIIFPVNTFQKQNIRDNKK